MSSKLEDLYVLLVLLLALILRVVTWPLSKITTRVPLLLPTIVLGIAAFLMAYTILVQHVTSGYLVIALVTCILATVTMFVNMLPGGVAPELAHVDHKVDDTNWLHS